MKQFEFARLKKPMKAVHDLSHEKKLTMNMADLVPLFIQEVLPADRFKVNMELLIRLQPMISPAMHRINAYMHFFFVPNRLIWDDWETFITGGKDGKQTANHPKFTGSGTHFFDTLSDLSSGSLGVGTLPDYLGLPVQMYKDSDAVMPPISQLPFRAYQLIYNQYYRDETLIDEVDILKDSNDLAIDDPLAAPLLTLRKRCWEKDYFTSCLPFAQRGDSVMLPLAGSAPVTGQLRFRNSSTDYPPNQDLSIQNSGGLLRGSVDTSDLFVRRKKTTSVPPETTELSADLSEATSTTINDLRRSFAIQRWLEKNARGGYRYIEQILVHFGIKSSDARLQRPEYLGGGKMPIRIGEVLQTSQSDGTPQGTMAGHGIAGGDIMGFSRQFEEHGFVIGILSVIPRTGYQQGVPKIFSKFDKFDYFQPEFAHIGEQPILAQELYLDDNEANNAATFGYQRRYAEYCYAYDSTHGQMRTTMDFWHLNRMFTSRPTLTAPFVQCDPDTRIFAVTDISVYGELIVQSYARCLAIRAVPKWGEPI